MILRDDYAKCAPWHRWRYTRAVWGDRDPNPVLEAPNYTMDELYDIVSGQVQPEVQEKPWMKDQWNAVQQVKAQLNYLGKKMVELETTKSKGKGDRL